MFVVAIRLSGDTLFREGVALHGAEAQPGKANASHNPSPSSMPQATCPAADLDTNGPMVVVVDAAADAASIASDEFAVALDRALLADPVPSGDEPEPDAAPGCGAGHDAIDHGEDTDHGMGSEGKEDSGYEEASSAAKQADDAPSDADSLEAEDLRYNTVYTPQPMAPDDDPG